jgi:hypothetical protein
MSRQNKVNPGMYTQRGRLTQDDAAREFAKQRAIGSEPTWQPVKREQHPGPAAKAEGADDDSAADEPAATPEKPARVIVKAKPAAARAKTTAKAKAPRGARKAVLARGAGKGSPRLAAGRKKKTPATAKRRR